MNKDLIYLDVLFIRAERISQAMANIFSEYNLPHLSLDLLNPDALAHWYKLHVIHSNIGRQIATIISGKK